MTKGEILEFIQAEQEEIATLKNENKEADYDYEEVLYKLEKMIKEWD